MKVALISDIHGNVPALMRVLEDLDTFAPDRVVVNGDVVSRGPLSAPCLDLLSKAAIGRGEWSFCRGNHEDYVAERIGQSMGDDVRSRMFRLSHWTCRQIGEEAAGRLREWPLSVELEGGVVATHASIGQNDRGVYQGDDDADILRRIGPPPAVFATAHTHVPFIRRVGPTLVVNSGSVGSPFDGDTRASYARLEQRGGVWHAEIVRLDYDRGAAERNFADSGCLSESGPLTRVIFQEWKGGTPLIRTWFRRYHRAVLAGEVDLDDAVDRYLASVS